MISASGFSFLIRRMNWMVSRRISRRIRRISKYKREFRDDAELPNARGKLQSL